MKRAFILFLSAILVLTASVALAADAKRLTLGTGGAAGVYFPLGGTIGRVLNTKSKGALSVTAQITGASSENVRLIEIHEVDLAIVQNDVAHSAYNGLSPFKNKLSSVRAVGRLYPEYVHVVASKDSGVVRLEDFKGKKVSVGVRGSGNEVNCRQMFESYGLTYNNMTPIFLPYGETANQFKDRALDGFVFTIGTPNSAIQDISTAQDVVFIPLDGAESKDVVSKFPYLVQDSIPANTYKGQTKPVPTLSVQAILVVNKDVPDDVVYAIAKTLYDNVGDIAKFHTRGPRITLKQAADGITIPFHPGATKYLKENGILQ